VSLQEFGVRRTLVRGGRHALLRQDRAIGLLVVRIRRVLPPSAHCAGHTRRAVRGHLALLITS
jgi:hypothetical protein